MIKKFFPHKNYSPKVDPPRAENMVPAKGGQASRCFSLGSFAVLIISQIPTCALGKNRTYISGLEVRGSIH